LGEHHPAAANANAKSDAHPKSSAEPFPGCFADTQRYTRSVPCAYFCVPAALTECVAVADPGSRFNSFPIAEFFFEGFVEGVESKRHS